MKKFPLFLSIFLLTSCDLSFKNEVASIRSDQLYKDFNHCSVRGYEEEGGKTYEVYAEYKVFWSRSSDSFTVQYDCDEFDNYVSYTKSYLEWYGLLTNNVIDKFGDSTSKGCIPAYIYIEKDGDEGYRHKWNSKTCLVSHLERWYADGSRTVWNYMWTSN